MRHPGSPVFAHTSPVYLEGHGPERARAIPALNELLDTTKDWIETQGQFSAPKAKEHLLEKCGRARELLNAADFTPSP